MTPDQIGDAAGKLVPQAARRDGEVINKNIQRLETRRTTEKVRGQSTGQQKKNTRKAYPNKRVVDADPEAPGS